MGEWSKKVGEVGEEIVYEFLTLIGWADAQKGIELPCSLSKHESPTHGIDYYLPINSQLINRTLDHLVISVKYSGKPYPSSLATPFKNHFIDLIKAIECFKKSQLRKESNIAVSSIDQSRDIGVLFWLANDVSGDNDVISRVSQTRKIEGYNYDIVYLVDNHRISFIYDTLMYLKSSNPSSRLEFFYPNTGKNYNPALRETSATILPVEYINASVIPIKLTHPDGSKTLVLSSIETFHKDRLKRLIGLAQDLSLDWTVGTNILFPDYNSLNHANDAQASKIGFQDKEFTKNVSVASFRGDFKEINNA